MSSSKIKSTWGKLVFQSTSLPIYDAGGRSRSACCCCCWCGISNAHYSSNRVCCCTVFGIYRSHCCCQCSCRSNAHIVPKKSAWAYYVRLRQPKLLADGKDVIRTVNIMLKHVFTLFFLYCTRRNPTVWVGRFVVCTHTQTHAAADKDQLNEMEKEDFYSLSRAFIVACTLL